MRRRTIRLFILAFAVLASALSCIRDYYPDDVQTDVTEDGRVRVRLSVQVPGVQEAMTRMLADNPTYNDRLQLWCLVFEGKGTPASNYLAQVSKVDYDFSNRKPGPNGAIGADLIPFEVSLYTTTEDAVLHFILYNAEGLLDAEIPEGGDASRYNPLYNVDFGPENIVIPALTTSGGRDAYWQRVALGCPISAAKKTEIDRIVSEISPVPLIRNFAKINVIVDGAVNNFRMTGFCVVNTMASGTIAPYNERYGFPSFVDWRNPGTTDGGYIYRRPYTYSEITTGIYDGTVQLIEDPGYPYTGTRPRGWSVIDKVPEMRMLDTRPKYLYERAFNENDHTYIIISGQYTAGNTDSTPGTRETFYKIDIGASDEQGIFSFHNILRNFNYTIRITSVTGTGYESLDAAAKGHIYNNNISAAVETQHLLSISNGNDMMYVNTTSMVLVTKEPVQLWYRYFEIKDNSLDNDDQIFDKVVCMPLQGEVVQSFRKLDENVKDTLMQGNNKVERTWEVIEITPNTPGPELKIQDVLLYRPNGLSRRVRLYLQQPWDLKNLEVYPGSILRREDKPDESQRGKVSRYGGKELTVFFELPMGLPKAMFPLQFIIESDRQNIENDKVGTIVVQSGQSYFENIDDIRIQYVKTVTWDEYDPDNDDRASGGSATDNYDDSGNYIGNVVRCRFLTITDLRDDEINATTTTLRIVNDYFNTKDVRFERVNIQ